MVNKQNPFGDQTPEAVFEAMKQKAMAEAQLAQSGFARQQKVAQWELAERLAQQLAGSQQPTPYPFTEEVALPRTPITVYMDQFQAVRSRLGRLKAALDRGAQPNDRDREAEGARIALGAVLTRCVETGLISEASAVAMVVAGAINNQPMEPEQAREQVNAALAQAISAGALLRGDADRIDAILAGVAPPSVTPSQGRSRPAVVPGYPEESGAPPDTTDEDARNELLERARRAAPETGKEVREEDLSALVLSVPELVAQIGRLEDLLYAALTVRPCHLPDHGERHRFSPVPCEQQASGTLAVLLRAVDVPPTALPRLPHVDPDGARAACCARDGNLGTWLVYGQTLDPQARFSSAARDVVD